LTGNVLDTMREREQTMADEQRDDVQRSPVLTEEQLRENDERMGIRDAAVDTDALAEAEEQGGEAAPAEPALPVFFIEGDELSRVEVDILYEKSTGKVKSVSKVELGRLAGIDFGSYKHLAHSVEWFDFSTPNYDDMATYRQRSSSYVTSANRMIIDAVKMRNFLLVWHLKAWSLRGSDGKVIELEHDEDGSLTSATIKRVYSVPATILDVVLSIFEKDVLLT